MYFSLKEFLKSKWKESLQILGVFVFVAVGIFSFIKFTPPITQEQMTGAAGSDFGAWVKFGDQGFQGYQTKQDPQKIDIGANPVGQNTFINDGDRISIRDFGYALFPSDDTRSVTATPVTSFHTFRKRDGTNIFIKAYDDELEYYSDSIDRWERLNQGYTTGTEFGFADHNTNSDQTSYVYFGNAVQNYSRWTGNISKITTALSAGGLTINVGDTTLWPSSGSLIYCGVTTTYSAKSATSFTIPAAASGCASGRGVAQLVEEFPAAPKGNILLVLNTRMFMAGVASSTQALFYSKIADASNFTQSGATSTHTAQDGGIINMPEGGGGITGMAVDEEVIYVFKRNFIKSVTFTQDADDLPVVKPIKPYDSKSQTVGAIASRAIFAGGNGIFFITPNNEIMNIGRIQGVDYPQVIPISDIIKPTVDGMDFSNAKGVYWKNKAYFAARQTTASQSNDVLLVYNSRRQAWESPILGFNVGDFSIGRFSDNIEDLYFGSAVSPNVFKVTNNALDDIYGVTANWRSREETFGAPEILKSIDNFYVEGYIDDNTHLTITLLLDEDGFTQTFSTTITGNENNNQYRFTSDGYNVMGLNPFGFERFGSNEDLSGKKKFRIYLVKGLKRVPFYSAQVEFASDGESQNWEVLQYAFHTLKETQEMRTNLIRSF